jgi:prepilin signal peptidase PulO-like enzyme (type II secretory pathway)
MTQQMEFFLVIVFGLILGSFCSLLSHRINKKQPIVFTRSKCVNCGTALKAINLIPLLSWIFQGGKCSACKAPISIRYPLIELSSVISFVVIYFALGRELDLRMMIYFLIASTFIVMSVVDLEQYMIPNILQYLLTTLVTFLLISERGVHGPAANIGAAFLYLSFGLLLYLLFYFTTKIEAIGVDDIKFFFVAGFMLGTSNFLAFILFTGIFGVVFGTAWKAFTRDEIFPFAPAMCLSAMLCLLFNDKLNPVNLIGSMLFFGT